MRNVELMYISNFDEWQMMAGEIRKRYPLTSKYLAKL